MQLVGHNEQQHSGCYVVDLMVDFAAELPGIDIDTLVGPMKMNVPGQVSDIFHGVGIINIHIIGFVQNHFAYLKSLILSNIIQYIARNVLCEIIYLIVVAQPIM